MGQIINARKHILSNKKTYKVGAATSLALLLAACGNGVTVPTEGDDLFFATANPDIIDGLGGVDTMSYENSTTGIGISLLNNIYFGEYAQGDILTNIENIIGSRYADELIGDANDNNINGGAGDDAIDGGEGNDAIHYKNSNDAVNIDLLFGNNTGGDAQGDVLTSIENVKGSDFNDTLRGGDNDNFIGGGGGHDIILGRGGDDDLRGWDGVDTLRGGAGADFLDGGRGGDNIDGGVGNDTIAYNNSNASVTVDLNIAGAQSGGDAQGDFLSNIENIIGSESDDNLTGDDQINIIHGGGGGDTIYGNGGDDIINGGAGHDVLIGGLGNDCVDGGAGVDELRISDVNATFVIDQLNNKIIIVSGDGTDSIASIEIIDLSGTDSLIQDIWLELSLTDRNDFGNNEANFLSWLGADDGYNYEGL